MFKSPSGFAVTRRSLFIAFVVLLVASAAALWTPDRDRTLLASRYLRAPSDLRVIDGGLLHVRDDGPRSAAALIMLHGLGSSLHTWEPWARALSSEFRVIRFDLPGSGLSAPDPGDDYTDARSHVVLTALMDSLGVSSATLIGNSMGGRIAWSFAAQYPERVNKLVLISPDGFASPGFAYDRPAEVPASLSLMRYALPKWMLRMTLEPAYANSRQLSDSVLTRYHDLLLAPGARDAMLMRMRQTVLTDPLPRLARITAPTLILWGERDAMIPVSNSADYLRAIPDAQLVTLPDGGHVPFEEAPAASIDAVRAFLR